MKRVFLNLIILLISILTFSQETITVTANSEDISQSLDLKMVAKLFAEASTIEQFENILNNPDNAYSNLDLNGDNQIDYLRVVETGSGQMRLIVIQAVLATDIFQDIAIIYVEKDKHNYVSVQIIGDEYIYGTDYIIRPVYIYKPIIYNWLWSNNWYCWNSPWYWGYYPKWWHYTQCYSYRWYLDRCYKFHQTHYCSFRTDYKPYHIYNDIHNIVSHREYANNHINNSFNIRNKGYKNASELKVNRANQKNSSATQASNTYSSHFTNRNTSVKKDNNPQRNTVSQQPSTRSPHVQHVSSSNTTSYSSTTHSSTPRTQQTNKVNISNRQTVSVQQNSNNGQIIRSPSSTYRSSHSTTPLRSSSFNPSYKPSGNSRAPKR